MIGVRMLGLMRALAYLELILIMRCSSPLRIALGKAEEPMRQSYGGR